MKSVFELILTGENLRTVIILAAIIGGFLLQNARMDKRFVEVDKRFVEVRAEIAAVRAELKADIAAVRAELKADIAAVRAELKADIDSVRAELKADIAHLKDNDFAHLGNAFKNLTYVLVKKTLIDEEDKAFIDTALDG